MTTLKVSFVLFHTPTISCISMRKLFFLLLGLGSTLSAASQVTSTSTAPIGPNLALGKAATASSAEGPNFTSQFAFDADYGSRWASDRSNPASVDTQWLAVDLGATYNITKVRVNWEAAYGQDYQIQVSADGSTWTTVRTVTGNTSLVNLLSGIAASGRYVRLYNTARGTGYGYSVYELEVSASNAAPTVQLTQPAANSTYQGTVSLAATAADADGAVSKVDFYVDNMLVGSDNTAPYTATWPTSSTGAHVARAIATDDNGATTTASERTFYTNNNVALTASLTAPVSNGTYTGHVYFSATAADADGTITKVEFLREDFSAGYVLLGTATASPYSYDWANAPAGSYQVYARATDNSGAYVETSSVSITVAAAPGNIPPSVVLTSPAANGTYTGNIVLAADASDPDGTVSKVEFYVDNVLVRTATASPYSNGWPTGVVANGPHVLKAIATDNAGATTTSAERTFYVSNAGPGQAIPGKLEAESYTAQSGTQTEPTADTGGGLNVGYLDAGDYLDYKATSAANDYYTVQFRVASWVDGARLQLQQPVGLEGIATLATVTLPNTGGGQIWQTVTVSNVTLPVGALTLRVKALSNGFNFNWVSFARQNGQQTTARTTQAASTAAAAAIAPGIAAYPNPSSGLVYLAGTADGTATTVLDQLGRTVLTPTVRNGAIDLSGLRAGSYFVSLQAEGKVVRLPLFKE
jgi:hypothetical protein